jgi:hypothetical protein
MEFDHYEVVPPNCVLKASTGSVAAGAAVTLYWESKHATYASSVTGEQGPTQGSIIVNPQVTTTYLKKVYDDKGNMGQCTRTVEVRDTTPASEPKVVMVPTKIDFGHILSLMGDGMASVMDGYLSLFGLSLE